MDHTLALIMKSQQGDKEARDTVFKENAGLVYSMAKRFAGRSVEMEDIVQIGSIGLLKAIDRFDISYDVKFSTYAVPMIIGEIKRFFRDNGKIKASRSLKTDRYTLKRIQEQLSKENGRQPRLSEIAEAMGISAEHAVEIMEASSALSNIASLDSQVVEEEYDSYYTQGSPESSLDSIVIKEEIACLKARERQVIVLRYYRDMTQQEIARIMGISQVQVSRIEKKALNEIRKKMAE